MTSPSSNRLQPCPPSPNCVSSLASERAQAMPPLSYAMPDSEALELIERVLAARPRTRVVVREPRYLRAEVRSRIFRFVDDVEFALDPETRRIHFRSASRTGYSDLGVNRRRMREICRKLARHPAIDVTGAPPVS